MRAVKTLMFLPLLMLLAATSASGYYFGGLDDYVSGVPTQGEKAPYQESGRETFEMFLTSSDSSGYYFGGLYDYVAGVPSQAEKTPFLEAGRETFLAGTFAGLDPENRVLLIDTQ